MGSFSILKLLWNSKIFNNLEENVKGQGESKFQKKTCLLKSTMCQILVWELKTKRLR